MEPAAATAGWVELQTAGDATIAWLQAHLPPADCDRLAEMFVRAREHDRHQREQELQQQQRH